MKVVVRKTLGRAKCRIVLGSDQKNGRVDDPGLDSSAKQFLKRANDDKLFAGRVGELRRILLVRIVFRSLKLWGRPVSTGMLKVRLRVRRPKHDAKTFGTYNCQR